MRKYRIAAILVDRIVPEVLDAGLEMLAPLSRRLGELAFDVTRFDRGSDYCTRCDVMMIDAFRGANHRTTSCRRNLT